MIILFNIFDLIAMSVEDFKEEAERYGEVFELHPCNVHHKASFFLAFGGTDMEKVINDIKNTVPIDSVECFKIDKYYGEDEEANEWLQSHLI